MCLGVPGQVVAIDRQAALPTGTVDFGGVRRQVCLAYVPGVAVGDHVVVHVGFAISIVDEDEASRTWALLEEMAMLEDELGADLGEKRRQGIRDEAGDPSATTTPATNSRTMPRLEAGPDHQPGAGAGRS